MRIIVSTHQGNLYNEEVDYVVVHSATDGEYAIMSDHIPVISVMEEGYIKFVRGNEEYYVVLVSGILEFHDNTVVVLVQEAHIGQNKDSAKAHLEEIRKERMELNKKEAIDFTQKEKELHENIKKAGAGSL